MAKEIPADEDPSYVRKRLRRRARALGVPDMDADEIADRALEKAMRTDRPQTPSVSLGRRAGQALKDERVEYLRRTQARPQCVDDESPELPGGDDPTVGIEFIETCREFQERLGPDALEWVYLKICGLSEREIGERPGWDPLKAGRIRKEIQRKGPGILGSILGLRSLTTEREAS